MNFLRFARFLLFLPISKLTEKVSLTGQRSTMVNGDLRRPWLIQQIWSIYDPHRCFDEDDDGGFRRTSVAALRRSPRPAVVAARSAVGGELPGGLPGVPCPPSGGGELLPRSRWWRRGRTPARNRTAWRQFIFRVFGEIGGGGCGVSMGLFG
jgi:hypothetical protein